MNEDFFPFGAKFLNENNEPTTPWILFFQYLAGLNIEDDPDIKVAHNMVPHEVLKKIEDLETLVMSIQGSAGTESIQVEDVTSERALGTVYRVGAYPRAVHISCKLD